VPAAFAFSRSSRRGQAGLGHISQGPRLVVTMTLGAPQASQVRSVAASLPRWGRG
jgi:hypothetical protein